MVPVQLASLLLCSVFSLLQAQESGYNYNKGLATFQQFNKPRDDKIFLSVDSLRPHEQAARSPVLVSPQQTFPSYKYPYFPSLTANTPSPRPKYDYPFPPIPTHPPSPSTTSRQIYPPTPSTSRHLYSPSTTSRHVYSPSPLATRRPLFPPAPAITFLDPEPETAPHIEVRHRSFTPRPRTGRDQLEEARYQAHLPSLTFAPEDHDDTPVPANETGQLQSPHSQDQLDLDDDEEDDEALEEDTESAEQVEFVTEETPDYTSVKTIEEEDYEVDVSENEVNTEITLGEVLDEIFLDPALPPQNRNDIPRSPQFFVPTPLPTVGSIDHSFHDQFIDSPEREGSFDQHRLRDEQDLVQAEMLHQHEEEEEEEDHLQTNIINILSEERPQGPKGRKVLKKRPIRIKIPAKISENLQSITIPESLHLPDVHELPSNLEITSLPPRQQLDFNPNQEPRQPKALRVFTDGDDNVEQRNDNIFDRSRLNLPTTVRQQQSALPQDFQPIFTSEADRTRSQVGQNIDKTASQFVPPASANRVFSAQSPPPQFSPFTPLLRQAEDYIFTPQQSRPVRPVPVQRFNVQQNPAQVTGDQAPSFQGNPIQIQQSFVEPVRSQKAFPQLSTNSNSLIAGTPTQNRFVPPQSRAPPPQPQSRPPPPPPQSRPPPPPPQSRPPPPPPQSRPPPPPPSSGGPPQNDQSLFQMINREAAVRPARTKLEMDPGALQNQPKSSALENLLAIAGADWDSNLHVSKTTSTVSNFKCPAPEGHFSDPESCDVYYQCAQGTAHAQTCQPGLKWNVLINMCDWEASVDCDYNKGIKALPPPTTQDFNEGQDQQQLSPQPQQQPQQGFSAFTAFSF